MMVHEKAMFLLKRGIKPNTKYKLKKIVLL
jgi:hypothetical protein